MRKQIELDTSNFETYFKVGHHDKDWYRSTEELIVKIYGKERLVTIASLLAITSINSSLRSNIRLFRKALHEIQNDLTFSNYLPVMKMQLERLRKGEPFQGRKINSFARAISGGTDAVVVDTWLARAFKIDKQYPRKQEDGTERLRSGGITDGQYTAVEEWVRNKAYDIGYEPRQLSAIIWSGVRIVQGGDRQTTYHQVLLHQNYNMFENGTK